MKLLLFPAKKLGSELDLSLIRKLVPKGRRERWIKGGRGGGKGGGGRAHLKFTPK
ncbi:MAG: hypothetical protein ABIK99_00470 [candidate division WOR-3 bacterium]